MSGNPNHVFTTTSSTRAPIALCLCFIMCMATLMLSLYLRSFGFNTVGLISSDQKVVSLLVSRPSGLSRYTTWRSLQSSKSKLEKDRFGKTTLKTMLCMAVEEWLSIITVEKQTWELTTLSTRHPPWTGCLVVVGVG